MDATREFTWRGGGGGEAEAGPFPTRAVVVVSGGGGARGRQPARGVYRALSGVTFQDLDMYVRQASSCHEPGMGTEEDEGLDSLDSRALTLTPSPDQALRGGRPLDKPSHAEGGYFSLERCLSDEDAAHLHDSLENLSRRHPPQAPVHAVPPGYPHPHPGYPHPPEGPHQVYQHLPTYVNPAYQHSAAYATPPPPPRHDYIPGEHSYRPVGRNYPHGGAHYPPECGYSPGVMYRQREGYVPLEGSMGGPVYEGQQEDMYHPGVSYVARENFPAKSSFLYPGYPQKRHSGVPQEPPDKKDAERKTSVLSADSLEDVPLSPTSPKSPPLLALGLKGYKDSLEDVRPRLVSELRDFFERQKSTTSTSSPESESFQESKTEEDEEEEEEEVELEEEEDEEGEDNEKEVERKGEKKIDKQPKNPAVDQIQRDRIPSVASDQTEDASSTTECVAPEPQDSSSEDPTKSPYESESDDPPPKLSPRHGDVAFLRATQDTPQTLLASTRLVQATLKPAAKATTFFISLGTKMKPPDFENKKKITKEKGTKGKAVVRVSGASESSDSTEGRDSPTTPGEDSSASSDPADYQESRLILRNFVHNWESESPPQEDSDIDEFFLVLDSTGGRANFSFPSGSSSMLSSVGSSSSSDQRSETTQSTDQDSFDDGNLADIGEPDTTSSSGLSPVQESATEDSSAPQTPEALDQPEDKDGFLETSHNVIVKPFLELGKDIARESHAGPVLGSQIKPCLASDCLLPIAEEPAKSGRECETVIDTVFCDSDDDCGRREKNRPVGDAPLTAARQASPSSDGGASCDTLCAASTPEGSRDTLCYSDETGRKVSSGQQKGGQPAVTESRPHVQPVEEAPGGAVHSGSAHSARGYANPHDIRGNEVTSGSVARDAAGESGTPDPSPGAALTLTPHTFDFTSEARPTPDLEALATLIADRIMNGSATTVSVSADASGSTSTCPAVPADPAADEGDEAAVTTTRSVVSGACSAHHPQLYSPAAVPLPLPHTLDEGESELVASSTRRAAPFYRAADVVCKHSGVENRFLCSTGKETHLWRKANKCVNMASSVSDSIAERGDSDEAVPGGPVRGKALVPVPETHPRKLLARSPMTLDKGDEGTEQRVVGVKGPVKEDVMPAMLRQDSRGSTCESLDSRKTSLGSTITSLDEDFSDMSPEDFFERRYSVSSGISSTSESTGRKFSTSSFASDDWEWFPGRKKSYRGMQWTFGENRNELGERGDLRKLSSVSTESSSSSGIGSMESGGTESRKFSVNSGISCLSKINEEYRTLTDADLCKLESFEEEPPVKEQPPSPRPEACHITLDGRRLSLPPPVWPREALKDVKEGAARHDTLPSASEGKGDVLGREEPEFIVKRAEILKTAHPGPRQDLTLDLPLICPSSCPLRRMDLHGQHDCDHALAHTQSLNSNDSKEKRKSLNFVPRLLKPKSRFSARRLTLHTFENIAEEMKKQQKMTRPHGGVAPESVMNLSVAETRQDDLNKEVEFRRNLVRDLEKLEAEIEAEVQALGSDGRLSREDDDAASTVVAFDSNESVASASSFSRAGSGAEEAALPSPDTDPEDYNSHEFESACAEVSSNAADEQRPAGHAQPERDVGESPSLPLPDSKSLPNLLDAEDKKLSPASGKECPKSRREGGKPARSMDTLLNAEEIVPCSNYEFSEIAFPPMASLDEVEEQEVIENFSDEDLVSDVEFEAFSETEHDDTDLDHLNLELFEPGGRGPQSAAQRLSKKQKKIKKIRRKFSFSSKETHPKDVKDAITSSLKRLKTAKQKIGQLVTKTLRHEPPTCPSSGESAAGSPLDSRHRRDSRPDAPPHRKDSQCSKISLFSVSSDSRGPEDAEGAGARSRRTSKSSDDWPLSGPLDLRLPDGHESAYSWSDADSDFEFVAMEPPRVLPVTHEAKEPAGEAKDKDGTQDPTPETPHPPPAAPHEDREVRPCHRPSNSLRSSKVPLATWEPFFCVLLQDEKTFTSYRSEEMAIGDSLFYDLPRMRLDGGARAFRRRWGYELTPPPTLVEEENEDDPYDLPPGHEEDNLSYTETRSLRDDYLFSSSQGEYRPPPRVWPRRHRLAPKPLP
ncbi:uncharacterized protein LOC127001597 isoform X2 [Eriocheir sinensis]|uniref:uncharacterized protein LOC127001597 isoform X2 n=1 Tax=Eriocheir sinensis TaxID=95602 RepID=UPI0021C9CFCF|nr:uncharacterized protein LOC127001597 isoform X2 [Eriocheir sinensis]